MVAISKDILCEQKNKVKYNPEVHFKFYETWTSTSKCKKTTNKPSILSPCR